MAKVREQNLLLKDNQKVQLGNSNEGEATHDGTDLTISTSAGINVSINSGAGGKIIIGTMNYPTADGSASQVLKTDGIDTMSWADTDAFPIGQTGVFGGGSLGTGDDTIDYITITTTGNATDFGDLTVGRGGSGACSNTTNERACFSGGSTGTAVNTIDYVTISTTGDAADFGDLTQARENLVGTSNA